MRTRLYCWATREREKLPPPAAHTKRARTITFVLNFSLRKSREYNKCTYTYVYCIYIFIYLNMSSGYMMDSFFCVCECFFFNYNSSATTNIYSQIVSTPWREYIVFYSRLKCVPAICLTCLSSIIIKKSLVKLSRII